MTENTDSLTLYSSDVLQLMKSGDPREIVHLFNSFPLATAEKVLASATCPKSLLEYVMKKYSRKNAPTSAANWRTLLLAAVASRPFNTPEHWEALYANRCVIVWIALAGNEATPQHILQKLQRFSHSALIQRLVGNTAVPTVMVQQLLKALLPDPQQRILLDKSALHTIHIAITLREQTVEERYRLLLTVYPADTVYNWEDAYRYITETLLTAAHQHPDVVSHIARTLPFHSRERKHRWSTAEMRLARQVLCHPALPGEDQKTLYRLLFSRSAESSPWDSLWNDFLICLLQAPHCPPVFLLDTCTRHPDPTVRAIAAANVHCPEEGRVAEALQRALIQQISP